MAVAGMGMLGDTLEGLGKAIVYLSKYEKVKGE
jgi:hypothetical protein